MQHGLFWKLVYLNTFLCSFQIAKDGHLSEASDKALNKVVTDFMATA